MSTRTGLSSPCNHHQETSIRCLFVVTHFQNPGVAHQAFIDIIFIFPSWLILASAPFSAKVE